MLKKLEATELAAANQMNDAVDEAFNFMNIPGVVSEEATQAQLKDEKLRAAREAEPSKAHQISLKDFYDNRKSDLEMLDGHKAFLTKDPEHSIDIL